MAFVPFIRDYQPFYIQDELSCYDTASTWGLVAKSNPYPLLPNPKKPYSNDWKDADGDDEYVDEMFYESQDISVQFYVRVQSGSGSELTLRSQIRSFFDFINGKEVTIYDSQTGYGRQKVRHAGYSEDSFRRTPSYARAIFTVKFKVNDPLTQMTYNSGLNRIVTL